MASPDEARVDEARDQSTVPASPSDPTPASGSAPVGDEPASAPQRRPRGAASFPGGPPPAAPAPAPADTPVVPPTPAPPPQFQVTTVKPAAASFPGGPPPPAPPPRDDPPAARARSETTTRPTRQPSEAEGARARAATGEATDTTDTTDPEDVAAGEGARTGGRRRRRGGRGRGAANPADTAERTGPDAGATEPAGPDAAPAVATTSRGLGGPSARDLAAEPTADGATPADPGATPADPGASQGELAPGGVGGSARTR